MNNILTDTFKNYNIILIDGSYMIFYRYHALKNWDNHKTDKLSEVDFMEKFINTANKIKPNNCELFVDDVVNLKFNKYIDILFTMTCLQHIDPLQIDLAIKNLCELNAKDIVLWECTNKTYINNGFENSSDNYMFGHNYEELFEKYNYKLVYSELWSNNITYLLQFEQI